MFLEQCSFYSLLNIDKRDYKISKSRWRKILKILWPNKPCRFDSGHLHQLKDFIIIEISVVIRSFNFKINAIGMQ